jgi:hypothetical protein
MIYDAAPDVRVNTLQAAIELVHVVLAELTSVDSDHFGSFFLV